SAHHRTLPSFPTRRSSDLATPKNFMEAETGLIPVSLTTFSAFNLVLTAIVVCVMTGTVRWLYPKSPQPVASNSAREERHDGGTRSEEHTSELQSLAYLVCR